MSGTGRGAVSPLGWARHSALIHDEALTIAPASKEDIAISLRTALTVRGQNPRHSVVARPAMEASIIVVERLSKYFLQPLNH